MILELEETQQEVISEKQIVARLKGCQKRMVAFGHEYFAEYFKNLTERLEGYADKAKTDQELSRITDAQRELRVKSAELERYFCGYLGEGFVKFKRHKLDTYTGEEKFQGDMLSLVENEDLEETIAISSITNRADNQYAESLWALNQRFSILNGGEKVDEHSNPLSPVQFCLSIRKALKLLAINTKMKVVAYKAFDQEFIVHLQVLFDEINRYLVEEGVLPNLRYDPVSNSTPAATEQFDDTLTAGEEIPQAHSPQTSAQQANVPRQGAPEVRLPMGAGSAIVPQPDPSQPSAQYQGELLGAIRSLQGHIAQTDGSASVDGSVAAGAPAAPVGGNVQQGAVQNGAVQSGAVQGGAASGRQAMTFSNQQLVGALQNLQEQARSITGAAPDGADITPQSVSAVNSQLTRQLQGESEDGAVDSTDMHTIDLVGMLFEYMLSDDNLPDSVKSLLSYLHTPFLKIAFIDKDFFEETEHPARLLLNSLAESGTRWVGNDGTCQYEIYPRIKETVSRVLEEFKNDVRLFAELLLDFSAYTKKIVRRQELMERRATEKVQGEEKLREVKIKVNESVRSRTDGHELPSAVLLLLLQPWSDYLSFVLLRYGDQSESWVGALGAVDDILWSIKPKETSTDKTRQMEMHDSLVGMIETAFDTIGYEQVKGKKLLDALISLQRLALQSKKAEAAPAPMRSKLETMASEKAGGVDEDAENITPEEQRMVDNLKMIEFGTWFEFDDGKRLKVAWYNSKTLHYMLVDQMGKKVAMKSGLELARSMLQGHTKVIAGSSKPFFERALENIFHNLHAQADAAQPESKDE